MNLQHVLRKIRQQHGLSQAQLGEKLGLTQSHISNIERGAVTPRLSTLQDLARLLDHELMFIPRQLIPVVEGLLHANVNETSLEERPLYALVENSDGNAENITRKQKP